ncbi:MAG TPA: hypothetical protein PKH69_11480 [Thiobacillaceae bacterium]|nr:hypothetical protein [Thiobacillaceae bacterium]HNU65097.1 hypothetical protein [Thiobacillaceae bacterium]
MHPNPLQTLLAERLQSARGLGWEMPAPSQEPGAVQAARTRGRKGVRAARWPRMLMPVVRRLGLTGE